jgi:hypothetical protein
VNIIDFFFFGFHINKHTVQNKCYILDNDQFISESKNIKRFSVKNNEKVLKIKKNTNEQTKIFAQAS